MDQKRCEFDFYYEEHEKTYGPPGAIFPLLLVCSIPGGGLVVSKEPAGTLDDAVGGIVALPGIDGLDDTVIAACDCCVDGEDNEET